jgi:hypothetical protein
MTICVSVKVRDGIVMGTDSMTQIQTSVVPTAAPTVLKAYHYARKLFRVANLPVAVETWGVGNMGQRTIESLVLEFGKQCSKTAVQDVAAEFHRFVQPHYTATFGALPPAQQPVSGFFVGGYTPGQPLAEEWEFILPRDAAPRAVRPMTTFGCAWRGVEDYLSRLIYGFDRRIQQELANGGVAAPIIATVFSTGRWAIPILLDAMPLQDGINFAEYLLRTTVGACEFTTGSAACGGPLQVAVIRPDGEFLWIAESKLHLRGVDAL